MVLYEKGFGFAFNSLRKKKVDLRGLFPKAVACFGVSAIHDAETCSLDGGFRNEPS